MGAHSTSTPPFPESETETLGIEPGRKGPSLEPTHARLHSRAADHTALLPWLLKGAYERAPPCSGSIFQAKWSVE